jgi:hypothetical protein
LGIKEVVKTDFQEANGMRKNANHILVMITDGNSDDSISTYYAVQDQDDD